MYQGTNTASKAEQLNRCTSYDPISIGGSSRRSSVASTTSLAAATIASRCTHHSQGQEPKHLNQTDNLVIQPQSLTLANEHFANSQPLAPAPAMVNPGMICPMVPSNNNSLQVQNAKVDNVQNQHADESIDPISNLILPDDMVTFGYGQFVSIH